MVDNRNLIAVDAGLFCIGMYIESGIYYKYKGSFVLVCKKVKLDKELLDQIQMVASTQGGVYVEKEFYLNAWSKNICCYDNKSKYYDDRYYKKLMEVKSVYNKVISDTFNMLKEVYNSSLVALDVTENISEQISQTISSVSPEMLFFCINEIRSVDEYLYTHSINVGMLNGLIGEWLGLSIEDKNLLIKVGILHDIGKIKIPSGILNKHSKLTEEEFTIIKKHPIYSFRILKDSGEDNYRVLQGVRSHHERMNGRGYPDMLTMENIPLFSRITAVSDVYDAMVSRRCYKEACSPFDILQLFSLNKFSDLDTRIVNVFLEVVPFLLTGSKVVLSNGQEGVVVYVSPHNYAYPIVKVEGKLRITDKNFKCIAMCTPDSEKKMV